MTALRQRELPPSVVYGTGHALAGQLWHESATELAPLPELTRGFTFDQTGGSGRGLVLGRHIVLADLVLANVATTVQTICVCLKDYPAQALAQPTKTQPLFEVRRLSGLSWDQIAGMLGVERRSVHNWAAGKPIARTNEQRLGELLGVLHHIDRGSAQENRSLLLAPTAAGPTLLQLLTDGEFRLAQYLAGQGPGRPASTARVAGETKLGMEFFGEAYARGEGLNDEGRPITVLSKPKLRPIKIRKASDRKR
jgi:hypothetical protein